MKKKIALSVCLMLIMFGEIYYFNVYNSVHEINVHANYVSYDTEEALSNAADIILYGSPEDKFENREHVNDFQNNGSLSDFYTLTNFKVKGVIKNSTKLTINESDSFKVIEPIGILQEIDGKKILETDSYKAMDKDTNYVIYLKYNGSDGYSIINMSNGIFDLDEINSTDSTINTTLDSIDSTNIDKHTEFLKSIKNKYSQFIN